MKNSIAMIFLVAAFVAGAVIFAGLYFGVVFGALSYLSGMEFTDRDASLLGGRVGAVAGPIGVVAGVALSLEFGWDWFKRADGNPDWVARIVGLLLGAPLVLIWLIYYALPAFSIVASYKALGFLAVVGFVGMAGWIHKALVPRN